MAPAIELARRASRSPTRWPRGSRARAASRSVPESKRIFQKNGAFYDVGETLVAAGAGADARADLEERRRTSSTKARRRSDSPRRWRSTAAHLARRSQELQGDRADAAHRQVQELHDHHVAAVELRRHRAARDARHPRGHRLREGGRRLGVGDSLRGRGDAPRLRRPQRVRRRSRLREGADRGAARSRVSRRSCARRSIPNARRRATASSPASRSAARAWRRRTTPWSTARATPWR